VPSFICFAGGVSHLSRLSP